MRPGEKLYEEMLIDAANTVKTPHQKIVRANESFLESGEVKTLLAQLDRQVGEMDSDGLVAAISPWIHRENTISH